jgi:creatinine amidohydrolase
MIVHDASPDGGSAARGYSSSRMRRILWAMTPLLDLPHARVRALIDTGAPVYLSVDPVEYHGPHLSLHNDALVSAGLIRDVHERLRRGHPDWPLLSAGRIDAGVGPVPGPGTRPESFQTVATLVERACRAVAALGARRVVLMTFHGGPLHCVAIDRGVRLLERRGVRVAAPFPLLLREMLRGDTSQLAEVYALVGDLDARRAMLRDASMDLHAGFGETSLALHYAPETVGDFERVPPCPPFCPDRALARAAAAVRAAGARGRADELGMLAVGRSWLSLRPFPGYTGVPHLASREAGAAIARVIADRFAALVEDVLEGRSPSPRPPFAWLERVTLGGRVPLT